MALSIIIPSKTASNLIPCVRAIREAGENHRIIVVDDGLDLDMATREFVAFTVDAHPCEMIQGRKPFCFARNINIGIKAAGNDDVVLLNDDAKLVTPLGFTMMARIAQMPEYGIVSSTCNNVGNPLQNPGPDTYSLRDEKRTLAFVCVAIRREVLNKVGPLDERFIGYGMDDDDYCLRVRQACYKLGIFDGCYVDHGSLVSSYRGGPAAGGDFRPNLKLFIAKHGVDNWARTREQSQFKELFPQEAV